MNRYQIQAYNDHGLGATHEMMVWITAKSEEEAILQAKSTVIRQYYTVIGIEVLNGPSREIKKG